MVKYYCVASLYKDCSCAYKEKKKKESHIWKTTGVYYNTHAQDPGEQKYHHPRGLPCFVYV
jgi:hypothetical protein